MKKFKNYVSCLNNMKDWQKTEAVLFASGKYLTEAQLVQLAGLELQKLKKDLK